MTGATELKAPIYRPGVEGPTTDMRSTLTLPNWRFGSVEDEAPLDEKLGERARSVSQHLDTMPEGDVILDRLRGC